MDGKQKGSKSETENRSRADNERGRAPILFEDDNCAGMRLFELSQSTTAKLGEQPQVVYVELAHVPPPELLLLPACFGQSQETSTKANYVGLIKYLRGRVMKIEQSFEPSPQLSAARKQFLTLYLSSGFFAEDVAEELNRRPEVVQAIAARELSPPTGLRYGPFDEPLLGKSHNGLVGKNPGAPLDNQWYIFRCGIDRAWEKGLSGNGVVISDIDWGFLTSHQDLRDRIKFKLNTMDGSANVTQGAFTICHGTAVLGIAGAANNGLGMAGVAFGAELWAIQAGSAPGTLDPTPWHKAIDYVREKSSEGRPKIIILEVQTKIGENIEVIPPIRQAVREAIAAGVVVCVAAGNGARDAGEDTHGRPIPTTGSILVGATKYDERENVIAKRSNFGPRVTVYAPGDVEHDLTCSSGADHAYRNRFGGTSGATPKVAGTVALMLEANPSLTPGEIQDILRKTGVAIKGDNPNAVGVFLNAERAVLEAQRGL